MTAYNDFVRDHVNSMSGKTPQARMKQVGAAWRKMNGTKRSAPKKAAPRRKTASRKTTKKSASRKPTKKTTKRKATSRKGTKKVRGGGVFDVVDRFNTFVNPIRKIVERF
jgi:hypothetical protein